MYDDVAVQRLILIQIFIETGYERKAVKRLLDAPTLDIMSEFDHMISTLEERRRRIDGIINTVKTLKLTALVPENTLRALGNMDVTNIYREKSFSDYWNESVEHTSGYSTDDAKDAELYIPFWYQLVAIGLLHDKPVDDPDVVECAKSFCDYLMNMILSDVESDDIEEDDDITPSEVADGIGEALTEMLSEPELVEMLEMQCGKNSATFIVEAVKTYCSSLTE
jgi:DNA-binding transcriptional MerR regulator